MVEMNVDFKTLTSKALSNMKREDINRLAESFDAHNVAFIESAHAVGMIDEESRDSLRDLYGNSMNTYRAIYRAIYETFGSPIYTASLNLKTGEVDRDEKGMAVDYTLKVLSPLVDSKVKFKDKRNNSIYVIFPKIKSVERAVDKLSSEINFDRHKEIGKLYDRYFEDDDIEQLRDRLQDVPNSISQLNDVCRLTISCKYLSDVKRIKEMLTELGAKGKSKFFHLNASQTRDAFETPLFENKGKYFDIKMYMQVPLQNGSKCVVEVQLKPDTIYRSHLQDHALYEKKREIKAQITASTPETERKIKNHLVEYYDDCIQKIRNVYNHEYNMMVLDKVYRIEDTDYCPLQIEPDNPKTGTYDKCVNFIKENYLVTSYDKFHSDIFSPDKEQNKLCFLKLLGKLPENFDPYSSDASATIEKVYGGLTHMERRRYKNIVRIAERYSFVIQDVINKRKKEDNAKRLFKQTQNSY